MKTINTYLKALFSFWLLSLVITLMAIVLLLAALNQSELSYDSAQERMDVLNVLEGQVRADLGEMQLQQTRAIFAYAYELPAEQHLEKATQASQNIHAQLTSLADEGYLEPDPDFYSSDISAQLEEFTTALDTHQQLFDGALAAITAGNDEEIFSALDELESDNLTLNDTLRALIIAVEQDRLAALEGFPVETNQGVLYSSLGMAACLVLALIGYRTIASTVQPLGHLRNMMTAIGGDRYRASTYADLLKQSGPAGNLARALDVLARGEQARNAGGKQEVERLRQELYESRRQRLKLYHDSQESE